MNNLVLNIPHASTYIPEDCFPKKSEEYKILKEDHLYMVDWYTDELFNSGVGTPVIAPVSRMVCDTERFVDDSKERMSKIGMGVCYRTTHDLKHEIKITEEHRRHVIEKYYNTHHRALELAVDMADSHRGIPVLLDCHSFSPEPLPYEPDQRTKRPDICLGTDDDHTATRLLDNARDFFRRRGYSVYVNRPYKGTLVPMKYLHSYNMPLGLMIEINRRLYLKEGTSEKNGHFDQLKKEIKALQSLLVSNFGQSSVYLGLARKNDPIFGEVFITMHRKVQSML